MTKRIGGALVALAMALLPRAGSAQNTSKLTAATLAANQGPRALTLDATTTERWYEFFVFVGRSYCVEAITGRSENNFVDSVLTIFEIDGTTVIGSSDNDFREPVLANGSRVCFVPTVINGFRLARVQQFSGTQTRNFDIRVVETTLFSPYYQVGGGYDGAPQIRNNTFAAVNVFFTAFTAGGTPLGCPSTAIVIPANGMSTFGVSGFCGTASAFGSASIAHTGPPGAISANITTFSAASGLSFDAAFTPRQDYRP